MEPSNPTQFEPLRHDLRFRAATAKFVAVDRFSDILNQLKRRYEAFGKRVDEAEAVQRWDTVVGPGIAKHTRAIRVEDQVLWVEVDHPIWKSELLYQKNQILEKLNGSLPESTRVQDILFLDPRKSNSVTRWVK